MRRKVVIFSEENVKKLKDNNTCFAELDEYGIGTEGSANDYMHITNENVELEVSPSDINLSSFSKKKGLVDKIWDGMDLNSRVRLKLLDIADDFWKFADTNWVDMNGILLTGSICNFNWSDKSDIDLHIVVNFSDVDEREDFVRKYYNSKKNDWNNEHNRLNIYGFPVEIYVKDINDSVHSNGVYDLEKNEWVKKPDSDDVIDISLSKYYIKKKAADIMTDIDDMIDELSSTDDKHISEEIMDMAQEIIEKLKDERKKSLDKYGESGIWNVIYKVIRRSGYFDKVWDLINDAYDKVNSIEEGYDINIPLFEEVVADGNAKHNPYAKRWKEEREKLKNFILTYGEFMTSMENGKTYKVYVINELTRLMGNIYCICLEYSQYPEKIGRTIYIRAYDKFTKRMFQPQFDTGGNDNNSQTNY